MPIKIAVISYINTLPFRWGLHHYPFSYELELQHLTPSMVAQSVLNGSSHLGIIPTAVIPELGVENIVSDWCIGAVDSVKSVIICSNKPIAECRELYMDNHSRTSQLLARVLMKESWKIEPKLHPFNYEREQIDLQKNYLLIGDKALKHRVSFKYVYDLALEWRRLKSLPFVFACWIASKPLESAFIEEFNSAMRFGVENIDKAIEWEKNQFGAQFTQNYLTQNISYHLDSSKREGLREFLAMGSSL